MARRFAKEFLLMNNYRYNILLWWSKADDAYIAEVPELPGCAADGERLVGRE